MTQTLITARYGCRYKYNNNSSLKIYVYNNNYASDIDEHLAFQTI